MAVLRPGPVRGGIPGLCPGPGQLQHKHGVRLAEFCAGGGGHHGSLRKKCEAGSFVPIKVSIYGQTEAPFSGTLTVSTLESDNDEGTEEYEYSYQVEVGPAETKTMEFYVP